MNRKFRYYNLRSDHQHPISSKQAAFMKKTTAILLFLCCNALLVFFEVHKQGQYLKLSYEIQKLQSQIAILNKQHSDLVYSLHAQQQPHLIYEIAEQQMGMKPIELKTIQTVPTENSELVIL